MNVTEGFWLWTRSFLDGRSQQVNLGGVSSTIKSCPAGVPQGSVISHTLFTVLVNDLENTRTIVHRTKWLCGTASHMQEVLDPTENMMKISKKKTKDISGSASVVRSQYQLRLLCGTK